MRALIVVFGSFGLALGLVSALAASIVPAAVVGWFTYEPLPTTVYRSSFFDWPAQLVVMPSAGLVLGVTVGVVLYRARWRLQRSEASADPQAQR